MYGFTDYQLYPDGKKETGWSYCYLIGFCIGMNILVILFLTLKGPFLKLSNKIWKKNGIQRNRKTKNQDINQSAVNAVQTTQLKLLDSPAKNNDIESPEGSLISTKKKSKTLRYNEMKEIS